MFIPDPESGSWLAAVLLIRFDPVPYYFLGCQIIRRRESLVLYKSVNTPQSIPYPYVHQGLSSHTTFQQCCGSMTFWRGSGSGSGSAEPCLWLMDPDPAIFIIDLTMPANKKLIFLFYFFCLLLFEGTFTSFLIKSQKDSQNSRNQGFSYYFCMMIEESRSESGSIPLTNGSGSRRPKNMWIR